ncbi:MAG: PAS domain S-box protein [Nitrospirae bacterium]|nr:PAS domain S-box protein [Nitrospirota bacterium]
MTHTLYWLIGVRAAMVTLLLGVTMVLQGGRGTPHPIFLVLGGLTYALTVAYLLLMRRMATPNRQVRLASFQIGADVLMETVLVARTGGIASPFSLLYIVSVSFASLLLRRTGGVSTAVTTVLLLGGVTVAQLYGPVSVMTWVPPSGLTESDTLHAFGVHGLALFVVGFMGGTVAEQLKRAGQSLIKTEEGLSRLQAFHENIVQSVSSGLFTTDAEGRITAFNRAAQEATGVSMEAARSRPWWEVFQWPDGRVIGADPSTVPLPHRFEAEGRRADGSRLVVGMTLAALTENGLRTGLVGIFKDLTQIRDMEEEMRRREWLASLGEMSAGMAHEIRNPLAALAGAMQMLRKDLTLEETNARLMDIATREAKRLDAIVTEFLLYARPPALHLKDCDINALLAETLDLIRHEVTNRQGITLTAKPAQQKTMAEVDPDQLKQVAWNLAVNAFDAMPTGGELRITTGTRTVGSGKKSGQVVEIEFRDTGEGIRKQDLDKIFLPFFTTKRTGSGLGLAAVHRIVDLHGGWIRVESEEGKGSCFVVCLPVSADAGPRLWHEGREPWKRF